MKQRERSWLRTRLSYIWNLRSYFKAMDLIVVGTYLLILILLSVFIFDFGGGRPQVEIKTADDIYLFSLEEDRELSFNGPLGTTQVQIMDGKVSVLDSPGRLKICIKSGEISQHGQWLACLPNKIFIRILREADETDLDAVVF